MSKTIAIIAARMNSTRFPGKVIRDLCGKPVLQWVVEAVMHAELVDQVWVATTTERVDDHVFDLVHRWPHVGCFRGSEEDVLERFVLAARKAQADVVVRLTGDCPLLDSRVIDDVIMLQRLTAHGYVSNVDPPTWPDGLDTECFTMAALEFAHKHATRPSDRETVTQFLYRDRQTFGGANLVCPLPELESERWVLDTAADLEFIQTVIEKLDDATPNYIRVLEVLRQYPELREINAKWKRNERFLAAVGKEVSS